MVRRTRRGGQFRINCHVRPPRPRFTRALILVQEGPKNLYCLHKGGVVWNSIACNILNLAEDRCTLTYL